MWMRHDDRVEPMDSAAQQEGNGGSLADALGDGAVRLRTALQPSAAVDEQGVVRGRLNENGVRLADVDGGDAQPRLARVWRLQHERDAA